MPTPGEAVLAQYRGVSLPYAGGVQQPSQAGSLATIAARPRSTIPVYRGGGATPPVVPPFEEEVPPIDEGLNLEELGIGIGAGAAPLGLLGTAATALVPAAGAALPALFGAAGAALPAVAGGGLAAALAGLGIAGISGLLDGVDAGANMGLFGVDWGDIFGLGQGDIADITGQKVVQSWNTGTAKFYRTMDGKIHTFTKSGVLKSWRPAKHIVVSKNPRMRTMIRANNRLDKLMKGVAKAVSKHLPKRVTYGQLPASMLSKIEKAALKG